MSFMLNLSGRRRIELVRQSEAAECGLASLAMVAGYHGYKIDLSAMRRRFNVSMKGMTLRTLIDIGSAIGLSARPVRCELHELRHLQLPAILHWGGNHFVVLERIAGNHCIIQDPSAGQQRLPLSKVSGKFTGIALELVPSPDFRPQRESNPLKLGSLLRLPPDVTRGLYQSVALSVVIELLLLAAPFYMQLVIDDALVKGDVKFLSVLALAFGLILLFRTAAMALRGITLQFISQTLSFDMQARVFHHLVRLPLEWFHKRHVGDIQSRFSSIQPIQAFIANGAIAGLLDGILGSLVLILMFLYSAPLAFIVLGSVLAYLVMRIATIQLQRRLAGDTIVTQAYEQTRFLEAVRAIETVKASGTEVMKETQQRNAIAAAINAMIRSGNLQIASNGIAALIDGLTDILVIYLGALAVIRADMTVGMLMAFVAYKAQFGMRLTNLVDQMIRWRMLSVDLERLSDIALSPIDPAVGRGGHEAELEGAIECRSLSFSYAFGEAPVLRAVDLRIAAGEYVAVVGPSGCGKSTLVKLLVGLYRPGAGSVLFDGRPIDHWNSRVLRQQIAVVTQDDNLMAGSIAENIALFDQDIDMQWVRECARIAQIEREVLGMPMGYETLVGDLGSSLSGGQKQRVMIARALYRRPRILILDEGTSHLDLENEQAINDAMASLDITRIVVAHRIETIRAASRCVRFSGGRLVHEMPASIRSEVLV